MRRLLSAFALCALLAGCQYARAPGEPPAAPSRIPTQTTASPDPSPQPTPPPVDDCVLWFHRDNPAFTMYVSTVHGGALELSPASWIYGGLGEAYETVPLEPLPVVSLEDLLFAPPPGEGFWIPVRMPDGSLSVRYTVSGSYHCGAYHLTYSIPVTEADLPGPAIETLSLGQGEVLMIPWDGVFFGDTWQLVDERTGEALPVFGGHSLLAVRATEAAGTHALTLRRTCTESGEVIELARYAYTIRSRTFTRQDLTATTTMTSLLTAENSRSDAEKTAAARAVTSPERFWSDPWIKPMDGRVTTQFGQMRYTNGRFSSVHAAVDIGGMPLGAPVHAAAPGLVTMADMLHISGNTVIIDHGWGVFSSYSHLDSMSVKPGDFVQMGEVVGLNGTTGYSTGPHLHYAVTVGGIFVDPEGFGRWP